MSSGATGKPRLVFIANSMYTDHLSGGDVHMMNMIAAAVAAGYPVRFLGSHAFKSELERRNLSDSITLTDKRMMPAGDVASVRGQCRLLWDYFKRFINTMRKLSEIRDDDVVYSNTDFWWDTLPTIFCKARRKLIFLAMDSPTLMEIIRRSRPDVTPVRLASLHYWLTQTQTLWLFRFCRHKRMLYVHPNQKPRLSRIGYREDELFLISSGMDWEKCSAVPAQKKIYDVIWTGRIHPQKGIDDLIATLEFLAAKVENFRAIIVGKVKDTLEPRIQALWLADKVEFAGFVSETEKFRLMKSSRLFLMPSRYESWGTVIAEALASELTVLAYDLDAYRPIFGDLVRYVKPFDQQAFKDTALELVKKLRANEICVDEIALNRFKQETNWQTASRRFLNAIESLK